MKKFKVYLICVADPEVEVEAENEEDALSKVAELYNREDNQCFTYSGDFVPDEAIEVE
jgi:hypothetical protein